MNADPSSRRRITTSRDVLLLRIDKTRSMAISCDAAGAIGSKLLDTIKADATLVGQLTARVALMELLAIGANPVAISGTFSAEPKPTGESVIRGIKQEIRLGHLSKLKIVCSSEKNFKVKQTGIGITAIGLVPNSMIKVGRCKHGDEIVAIGELSVGREVIQAEANRRIADTLDVVKLRKSPWVHELIPVGSRGILYEAKVIAKDSGMSFEPSAPHPINLKKSAGPATVLLVAIRKGSFSGIRQILDRKRVRKVGTLQKRRIRSLAYRELLRP